jgi:hypothetical protein
MVAEIKISTVNKITTIRLTERTKLLLESVAIRKETHEDIILRLIRLAQRMNEQQGTEVVQKGKVSGVRYERLNQTFSIQTEKHQYDVVCVFNNLGIYALLRYNPKVANEDFTLGWELDLKIVNIRKDMGKWEPPEDNKLPLLYFAAVKHIIETFLEIKLHEFVTDKDYLDFDLWRTAYKRHNLPEESFTRDISSHLY